MLQFYLVSILIWCIIIYCTIQLLQYKIIDNGWFNGDYGNTAMGGPLRLLMISAIPVLRLLVFSVIIYMSIYTEEYYQETKNKYDKDE